jgi:hypothetical protein
MDGQKQLLFVVAATDDVLPHFLHSGQEQSDQYRDDGDDDEQLDQREPASEGSGAAGRDRLPRSRPTNAREGNIGFVSTARLTCGGIAYDGF